MADGSSRPTYGAHPDAMLLRKRRMERARVAVTLALAMTTPLKPKPERRGGNPKPRSRAKPKTCHRCLTVYPQSKGYFSHIRETVCYQCTQKLDARRRARQAVLDEWIAERKARKAREAK